MKCTSKHATIIKQIKVQCSSDEYIFKIHESGGALPNTKTVPHARKKINTSHVPAPSVTYRGQ